MRHESWSTGGGARVQPRTFSRASARGVFDGRGVGAYVEARPSEVSAAHLAALVVHLWRAVCSAHCELHRKASAAEHGAAVAAPRNVERAPTLGGMGLWNNCNVCSS